LDQVLIKSTSGKLHNSIYRFRLDNRVCLLLARKINLINVKNTTNTGMFIDDLRANIIK
jgi:hypothetical protein